MSNSNEKKCWKYKDIMSMSKDCRKKWPVIDKYFHCDNI